VVREDPNKGSCTVFYSCNVQLRKWAPGWLDRYVAKEGLPRAICWLKKEAEARELMARPRVPTAEVEHLPEPPMRRMHRRSLSNPTQVMKAAQMLTRVATAGDISA